MAAVAKDKATKIIFICVARLAVVIMWFITLISISEVKLNKLHPEKIIDVGQLWISVKIRISWASCQPINTPS